MPHRRVKKFFKDFTQALIHCAMEESGLLALAIPVLLALYMVGFLAAAIFEFLFDPHVTSAAALDSVSISPGKWVPR